jgi:hypothetical protein
VFAWAGVPSRGWSGTLLLLCLLLSGGLTIVAFAVDSNNYE